MSGPRYSRETFAPPDSDFAGSEEPNGTGRNGAPAENVDETRPHSTFGDPGPGPAGGYEPRPFVPPPPPLYEPAPEYGDGFGEPTLSGDPFAAPRTEPPPPGVADAASYTAPAPAIGDAPASFGPPPGAFDDLSPNFDRLGPPGPSVGFGDPTVGMGPVPGPPIGTAGPPPYQPPMGPPPGVGAPAPSARMRSSQRARGPRRAKLQLRHINPWTVLKFSCVLSVALFFVWLITIGLLYGILQAAGVIDHINNAVTTINGNGSKDPVTPGLVFGGSAILGVINVILFIALSTVGSIVYNLCADLVGGVEVTLSERD
jgi:hypothetical protein